MQQQLSSMLSWQKNKKADFSLDKQFKIVYTMWRAMEVCNKESSRGRVPPCCWYATDVRMWRNWQTRTVQVRVSNIV